MKYLHFSDYIKSDAHWKFRQENFPSKSKLAFQTKMPTIKLPARVSSTVQVSPKSFKFSIAMKKYLYEMW